MAQNTLTPEQLCDMFYSIWQLSLACRVRTLPCGYVTSLILCIFRFSHFLYNMLSRISPSSSLLIVPHYTTRHYNTLHYTTLLPSTLLLKFSHVLYYPYHFPFCSLKHTSSISFYYPLIRQHHYITVFNRNPS